MNKTCCSCGALVRVRRAIALLLAGALFAPGSTLADENFVQGTVIGKNDSGKGLAGVMVQSDTTVAGKPCLLGTGRTDNKGAFRVRTDPACSFLKLRFSRGGFFGATVDVNISSGENDIGVIELEGLRRAGAPAVGFSGRAKSVIIGVISAITGVAAGLAVKR
jgi:hypothetical protein